MNKTVRPGFFVVGAPKCGTTSLYAYLKQHPQIYLPRIKELNFFLYRFAFQVSAVE
jgi:lipid A disaccharide synthetase